MSRCCRRSILTSCGFPRVSGDEPDGDAVGYEVTMFSPRERG